MLHQLFCADKRGFLAIAFLTSVGWASSAVAEPPAVLDIVGGNSASNELLWLNFDGGNAEVLNTDANTRSSLRSFDFLKNICENRVDLIAADTNRGDLLLYANGRGEIDQNLCASGPCPGRPDGISLSTLRRMSVADTGSAGTEASVWFFEPKDCDGGGGTSYFESPKSSGLIKLNQPGPDPAVGGIKDTEFVNVLGGGLSQGDVLVLVSEPTALVRYKKADIDGLIGSNTALPSADVLLDASFFGEERPTAMAFIPGTGGIGSLTDQVSQSQDLLMTLTGGRLIKVRFESDGNSIVLASPGTTLEDAVFLDQALGNGPLGIDAGVIEQDTLFVVADRQQGSFLRFSLDVDGDGNAELLTTNEGAVIFDVLRSGVQNPQGAAINSEAVEAGLCVDQQGTADQTGCRLFKTIELHYPQLNDVNTGVTVADTVLADIEFIIDEGRNSAGELIVGDGFKIPPSCVGLPLPDDDATSVIIFIRVTKSFEITPGNFVQYQELADEIIPQLGGCKAVGTRVFYHPDADVSGDFDTFEDGTMFDTTFFCENPSRSIGRDNSPVAICADKFYRDITAANGRVKGNLAKALQAEIQARADAVQFVVDGLDDDEFGALPIGSGIKETLLEYIADARADVKKKNFAAASAHFDEGVLAVYAAKGTGGNGELTSLTLADTTYGDLLSRFLALAFFSKETATQQEYCPPELLRTDGEVVDVSCP
jgi:hypothetical protein